MTRILRFVAVLLAVLWMVGTEEVAAQAPTVTGLSVNTPAGDGKIAADAVIFYPTERIRVTVTFSASVDVTGTPHVVLGVATCPGDDCIATYASGTGTNSLVFEYRVRGGDVDNDGISIAADALKLNGGAINASSGGAAADLNLGTHAFSDDANRKVGTGTDPDSSVRSKYITSISLNSPPSGDTFILGDTIELTLTYNFTVRWSRSNWASVMKGALTIGDRIREADYVSGAGVGTTWTYRYVVQANDVDADGISVVGEVMKYGSVESWTDRYANRQAIVNSANHKVDGHQGPPGIVGVALSAPPGDTYGRDETIEATVTFTQAVNVTGTPQLALGIASGTKQANYVSGTGTKSLVFRYTVVQADVDSDGISIAANALTLNAGTILQAADGTTNAQLGLGDFVVSNSADNKVDGAVINVIALSEDTLTVVEEGTVTYTVALAVSPSQAVTVSVMAPAASLTASPDTLTFQSTDWNTAQTVTLTAKADPNTVDETVTVRHSGASGQSRFTFAASAATDVTVMIEDNDTTKVTLALSPASISENGGVSTVTALLDGIAPTATTITVSAEPDPPAVAGVDFSLSTARTLTIAADSLTSTGLVTIRALDDTLDAEDKSVTVSGMATGGKNATVPSAVTLTITDDDDPPILSISSPSAAEGNAGSAPLSFGVMLSAASEKQITVAYADAGTGSATAGADYTTLAADTLTFTPGTTRDTLAVSIIGDETDEPDETVVITLRSLVNAVFPSGEATLEGSGTITDDDPAVATLVLSPPAISEAGGLSTVTATLSTPEDAAVTITVSATAVAPAVMADFTLSTTRTLTIAADSLTSTGLVTIRAEDDTLDALDKSVTVSGTADDTPDVVAPPAPVTLTITDDDPVSIPDDSLRAVIEDSLDKAIGATITRSEMATLTRLIAPNKNISDLTGLEFATGLDTLDLSDNNIEDIQPLVDNTGLGTGDAIDLRGNHSLSDPSRDVHIPALEGRGVSVQVSPATNLDIDNDGTADLTDAIMVILYLFGLENEGITNYILFSDQAQRTNPQAVTAYIQTLITTGRVDIDADGTVDLTDIIMVILYLFGLENEGITDYILFSQQATRTDPQAVTAYIASLLP